MSQISTKMKCLLLVRHPTPEKNSNYPANRQINKGRNITSSAQVNIMALNNYFNVNFCTIVCSKIMGSQTVYHKKPKNVNIKWKKKPKGH